MKLLKSIKQHSRLLIGSLLTTVFLFAVLIGFLLYLQFSMGTLEKEYTLLINEINHTFVVLQKAETLSETALIREIDHIDRVLREARETGFLSLRWILPENFPSQPSGLSPPELEVFYDSLVEYTKEFRGNKFNLLEAQVRTIYIILIGLLFLILFVGILLFLYLRRFYRYTNSIGEGINLIDQHLNYQMTQRLPIHEQDPQEIQDFIRTINRIENDIDLDQFLDGIESYGRLADVLEMVAPVIRKIVPFDRIALAFNDANGLVTAESAYTTYKDIFLDPGKSEPLEQTSLGRLIKNRESRIIPNLLHYARDHEVSQSTKLILREGIQSSLTVPLLTHNRCIGFLFLSSLKADTYEELHLKTANRIANKLKNRFYNDFLIQEVIAETANSFVALVNEKDNETSAHLDRMTQYSHLISRALSNQVEELSPQLIREIHWFASLHDIGKIGIPDAILCKTGPLTPEEMGVMKQHVALGERILMTMNANLDQILSKPLLQTAVDIIQAHHERYDGKGYPRGLKGDGIPLAGRIVAAADVFDALTSKRTYKEAYSIDESLRIMEEEMAGAFDPLVLSGLRESLGQIRQIYDQLKEV